MRMKGNEAQAAYPTGLTITVSPCPSAGQPRARRVAAARFFAFRTKYPVRTFFDSLKGLSRIRLPDIRSTRPPPPTASPPTNAFFLRSAVTQAP